MERHGNEEEEEEDGTEAGPPRTIGLIWLANGIQPLIAILLSFLSHHRHLLQRDCFHQVNID